MFNFHCDLFLAFFSFHLTKLRLVMLISYRTLSLFQFLKIRNFVHNHSVKIALNWKQTFSHVIVKIDCFPTSET